MNITYMMARLVEAITNTEPQAGSRRPSLRVLAASLGLGERNAYRLLAKIRGVGFSFSLSVNLARMGYAAVLTEDQEWGETIESYRLVDGTRLRLALVPAGKTQGHRRDGYAFQGEVYIASRPLLARLGPVEHWLKGELTPELRGRTAKALREALLEPPPRGIWGRRYRARTSTIRLLALMIAGHGLDPISYIARILGVDASAAQRGIRSLWRRGVIMRYGLWRAPYMPGRGVLALLRAPEPLRLANALPVAPPVACALAPRSGPGWVAAKIDASDEVIAALLSILKDMGVEVGKVYHYYRVEAGDKAKAPRSTGGASSPR